MSAQLGQWSVDGSNIHQRRFFAQRVVQPASGEAARMSFAQEPFCAIFGLIRRFCVLQLCLYRMPASPGILFFSWCLQATSSFCLVGSARQFAYRVCPPVALDPCNFVCSACCHIWAGGHRLDSDRVDGYARQLAVLFGSQQVLKWGQTGNGSVPEVPSAGDIH